MDMSAVPNQAPQGNISTLSTPEGLVPGANTNIETAKLNDALIMQLQESGYILGPLIGRGGFASVYQCMRMADHSELAIKILNPQLSISGQMRMIFLREMAILTSLEHPHIVRILGTGKPEHVSLWYVMEFVNGPNLEQLVQQHQGCMLIGDSCSICLQSLDALGHIHEVPAPEGPFVHRDVKPRNILVSGNPGSFHAKLADFGLAKNFEKAGHSGISQTGNVAGTLAFMPPEQLIDSKYVMASVDLYAMGCVLYYMLTGTSMYDVDDTTRPSILIRAIMQRAIVPIDQRRPDVPKYIRNIIEKATAHPPERRFNSAKEMISALMEGLQKTSR